MEAAWSRVKRMMLYNATEICGVVQMGSVKKHAWQNGEMKGCGGGKKIISEWLLRKKGDERTMQNAHKKKKLVANSVKK